MKRFRQCIVVFILSLSFFIPTVYAATPDISSDVEIIYFDDGSYLEITTVVSSPFSGTIVDASKEYVYKNILGTKYFSYTLYGRFEYTGTTSKATDVTSYYDIYDPEWNFGSSRESYSGNTVYGSATFGGPYIKTVGGSISCDKNGNIT